MDKKFGLPRLTLFSSTEEKLSETPVEYSPSFLESIAADLSFHLLSHLLSITVSRVAGRSTCYR